jgi:hypothetical protein
VGEGHHLPLGEGFGDGELDPHLAIAVGNEIREEESRFVQVLARRDVVEIRARAFRAAGLAANLPERLFALVRAESICGS